MILHEAMEVSWIEYSNASIESAVWRELESAERPLHHLHTRNTHFVALEARE